MSLKSREGVNKYYESRIAVSRHILEKAQADVDRLEKEKAHRLKQVKMIEKKERNIKMISGNLKSLLGIKTKRKQRKK